MLLSVWARRAERVPTLVVLDEAHHICPAEPADPIQALATELAVLIAGEGRKYGIFLLVATQRPQKVHPSVVAGCESLVLLRMNSLRDVGELEASFSHVPEGLLRLAPGFVRGEALVAGPLAPAPLHLRVGGRITPEGGGDVPSTWARRERRLSVRPPAGRSAAPQPAPARPSAPAIRTTRADREPNDDATPAKNSAAAISSVVRM